VNVGTSGIGTDLTEAEPDRLRPVAGRAEVRRASGRAFTRAWLLSFAIAAVLAIPGNGVGADAGSGAGAGTAPSALQPHRAIYRLSLAKTAPRGDVAAADGSMFYRFAQGCDGWTVENRTVLHLTFQSGGEAETVWTFASWESADGLQFRFYTRYEQDGEMVERLAGRATLEGPGAAGTVTFSEPADRVIALPLGTLFPAEHIRAVTRAAERGEKSLETVVFDGASLDNPYLIHAVIKPLPQAQREQMAAKTNLPVMPAWLTHMAFFPYHQREPAPEFEIAAHYRADGIADRIIQYFSDFTLSVQLGEFEALARPDC